ncbi:hypothetical protein LN650_01770 [Klebsiella pneumoniae subsp. pneumoniae]|nr:hypothetical protein [Klebsiella pneumoniae subsp. pneumoniae]
MCPPSEIHTAEASWNDTFAKAKDVQALDPQTMPQHYLKYCICSRTMGSPLQPGTHRANEGDGSSGENVFSACRAHHRRREIHRRRSGD